MEAAPNKYAKPIFVAPLSARWQQVAIQQAAGIARSWRTNREAAHNAYLEEHATWLANPEGDEPQWHEWHSPQLKVPCIQANRNVVLLEPNSDGEFDYWLRISTLEAGKVIRLPVKLSAYHHRAIGNLTPNSGVILTRKRDSWWLTLTVDDDVPKVETTGKVGVDVGITNFITTSRGRHYGTLDVKLRQRLVYEREKRRRKAKLRACLKKKGTTNLPSVANRKLSRHIRQSINRAVNQFYADHPNQQVAIEALNVKTMKFKARAMNAYLKASNLAHVPEQLMWGAKKRGVTITCVKSAYTSQCCSRCYYTNRENRPNQQTFCCGVCGFYANADDNAALNIEARLGDREISACKTRDEIKALLAVRHALAAQRMAVVHPPAQLGFQWA